MRAGSLQAGRETAYADDAAGDNVVAVPIKLAIDLDTSSWTCDIGRCPSPLLDDGGPLRVEREGGLLMGAVGR